MSRQPLILSIGGGKGGVGKSFISSNFAVQYAKAGLRTILVDLDMGAANIHTLFGVRQPPKGLGEYFTTPRSRLADYILPTEVEGLSLVAGSGFVPELANIKHTQKVKIINQIRDLDADLVLLDLGAGSSINVVDFFSMTNAGMIVTSPEPTAIINAYEFLKNVVYRILFRMFKNQPEMLALIKRSAVPETDGKKTPTLEKLIETIAEKSGWAAENIREICGDLDFYILFNQARKPEEAELARKLHGICKKYLGLNLHFGGLVFYSEEVSQSVLRMSPLSVACPDSPEAKSLKRYSAEILRQIAAKLKTDIRQEPFERQLQRVSKNAKEDWVRGQVAAV